MAAAVAVVVLIGLASIVLPARATRPLTGDDDAHLAKHLGEDQAKMQASSSPRSLVTALRTGNPFERG